MPYDPQRSRRRPQAAEEGPAPVDAILSAAGADAAGSEDGGPVTSESGEPALRPAVDPGSVADEVRPGPVSATAPLDVGTVDPGGSGRRLRALAILSLAALLVAVLVTWSRRRRRG